MCSRYLNTQDNTVLYILSVGKVTAENVISSVTISITLLK